jgi:hypothetical protein
MAIAVKSGKLILYVEAEGQVAGYQFDIIDGFNLSYLLLGATLQHLREMGKDMSDKEDVGRELLNQAGTMTLEAFNKMFEGIDLDLDKPGSGRDDNLTEEPPDAEPPE